jgi:hypothetical protein
MNKSFDLGLFRAQPMVKEARQQFRPTTRWPGNVSYLVDNLWEWRRGRHFRRYPSRQHAVFAYSREEQARKYAKDHPGLVVYRVVLHDRFKLCQLPGLPDSRHHADCTALPQEVYRILGEQGLMEDKGWAADVTLKDKQTFGSLWIPGQTAKDIEALSDASPIIRHLLEAVERSITYWQGFYFVDENGSNRESEICSLFTDGEIFIEPTGGYELRLV